MVRQIVVTEPLLKIACTLGEGPVYDPETSILHFVDIDEHKIIHYNTVSKQVEVEQLDEKIGCIALRRDGPGLAGCAAKGFALFEGGSTKKYLSEPMPPEFVPFSRFNDGACDSAGRFIAGTMYDKARGIPGQLWRYDPQDGTSVIVDPGPFTDSNGLGWSPDEKIFYFTDSIANIIYAYDYDVSNGSLSNRRVFVDAMALGCRPKSFCDGLCVDSEGYVWGARWGGSNIVRFSPAGEVDLEVVLPRVLHVTACCFGGDVLYITTASCKASGEEERQEKFPDSGHLFCVEVGVEGAKRYPFGG